MDTSLESNFDITAEVIESTPIEKCSLNPRRGRNSRRLLTGFIIYASEVRKEVVEKYPDQNFGFISKLVGDKWRELPTDLRFKYHQRALIHNKRIKELAAREGVPLGDVDLATGSVIKAPKISKKKKDAKLSKREKSLNDSSASTTPNLDKSSASPDTPTSTTSFSASGVINNSRAFGGDCLDTNSSLRQNDSTANKHYPNNARYTDHQYIQPQPAPNYTRQAKRSNTVDSATQTPSIRFVDPPPKKPLTHSEAFRRRLRELYMQKQQLEQQLLHQQQGALQQQQHQQCPQNA